MKLLFLIWREWRLRSGRAILTVMSVGFAVAIVFGSLLAASMVRRAYSSVSEALEGPPILEIVAAQGGRFESSRVPPIDRSESILESTPLLFRPTSIHFEGKRIRTVALGMGGLDSPAWSRLQLAGGRMPKNSGEILLDEGLAKNLSLTPPGRITMLARRGTAQFEAVGIVSSASLREYGDGIAVVAPVETMQKTFGLAGQIDRVRVYLDSLDHRESVRRQLVSKLGSELIVIESAGRMHLAEEILRSTELALQFACVLALAMAAFIIVNTLRMNFSERRWQYAVMRAMGATSPQIRNLVMVEGLAFGIAGAIVGIPGGLALAKALSGAMQSLLNAQLPAVWPSWKSIALGVAIGPTVALFAAWFVARQSRRLSPLEGIQGVEPAGLESFPRRALLLSFAAWLAAVGCLAAVATDSLSVSWALPAGLVMLVAFILLIPAVLRPLMQGFLFLLPRSLSTMAFIASRQARQRITRIGLTVGILVVAISNGLGLGQAILNNVGDVRAWYRRSMSGDFFLQPVGSSAGTATVDLAPEIRAMRGVARVERIRFRAAKANEESVTCVIREFDPAASLLWNLDSAQEEKVRRALEDRQVVISSVLAKRLGIQTGDSLRLEIQGRTHLLPVAASVNDYSEGGLVVFLDLHAAEQIFEVGLPDWYVVSRDPNVSAELEGKLRTLAESNGFGVLSFQDLRRYFDRLINGIVSSLFVLMGIGYIVGGLGVSNTLAMSVLEQTREIGLLRIIGMTCRQTRRLILMEGMMIGCIGSLLGALAGLTTAYIIHICNWALLDRSVAFVLNGWLFFFSVAGCLLVVFFAAWTPARQATKLDLLTAIAYE